MENFEKTTEKTIAEIDCAVLCSLTELQKQITELERKVSHPKVTFYEDGALQAELVAYVKYLRELLARELTTIGTVEPDREDQELDYEIQELELLIKNTKDTVRELVGEDGPEGVQDVHEIHHSTIEIQEENRKVVEEKMKLMMLIEERKKEAKLWSHNLELIKEGYRAKLEEATSNNKKLQQESSKLKCELDLLMSRLTRKKVATDSHSEDMS